MPTPSPASLFQGLQQPPDEEVFDALVETPAMRIERIVSPPGHRSASGDWYDQERDEWVLLLRGRAALEIEGKSELVELGPGDHLLLPAHLRHRVAWTAADEVTLWLAVHWAAS